MKLQILISHKLSLFGAKKLALALHFGKSPKDIFYLVQILDVLKNLP